MDLRLLLLECGSPVLLPTGACIYSTELGMYYTPDVNMNTKLVLTPHNSNYDKFRKVYGVRFTRYTSVRSITLNQDMVFMFGNNQRSGDIAFLVIRMPQYLMYRVSLCGLVLGKNDLLTCGCISEIREMISYEDYTLMLFDKFKKHMTINLFTPNPRTQVLDFYSDDGRLFYIWHLNTVLHDVKIDKTTDREIYVMKFQ
ncbi:hypothetical protein DRF75_00665 [Ehrlichia minasensis]|uniref:Uncharacterized protein n=1 Tax=Ehrlichia minasensis TaxID=1242993 RepID=A0A4Q6I8Y5_9RICK|nr:hypothetical protein [Ehrlichia minasensis]RZB13206.1 hypothetical protein DRF75_00665 [Ehrlichia minasensis]